MKPKDVDEYIASVPTEAQGKLQKLRAIIKTTAPLAKERISYGMPFYEYKGRLAYFQLWRNHLGLYIPPPIIDNHKEELRSYETTISTIRLPLEKKLPVTLIRKLLKARMGKNDEKKKISNKVK